MYGLIIILSNIDLPYFDMANQAQTSIHSKIAKQNLTYLRLQKINDASMGEVVKGTITEFGPRKSHKYQHEHDPEIMREIEILPKNKLNVARKIKNKRIIPRMHGHDQIVLMESSIFPAIYFKKTATRNVLKEFSFPENCQALPPEDSRTPLIYQMISNLFNQINFYIFNILIGENLSSKSYYVFFSDSETIPFTKCCNAPVFIELLENGSGKVLCNASNCEHPNLAEFLINFEDGRKLWTHIPYFSLASMRDKSLKSKISKLILSGKFKKRSLGTMVEDTSKEIVDLFYSSKTKQNLEEQCLPSGYTGYADDAHNPFLTAANGENRNSPLLDHPDLKHLPTPQHELSMLLEPAQKNIDTLKMKLLYVTKKQKDLPQQISKTYVEDLNVFHKSFGMIRRMDELMLKNRSKRNGSKVSFKRLMSQVKKMEKAEGQREDSRLEKVDQVKKMEKAEGQREDSRLEKVDQVKKMEKAEGQREDSRLEKVDQVKKMEKAEGQREDSRLEKVDQVKKMEKAEGQREDSRLEKGI